MALALAVDIGGTKLAVGLVGLNGEVITKQQVPTGHPSNDEEMFATLTGLVSSVLALTPEHPVVCGVGCGGPMSFGGEDVSPLNIPVWRQFPLRSRLEQLTGLPTFVDNDAKALALAEGWFGAAHGRANFIGIVVSTGVGGGIVLENRLLHGRLGNAGHVGHIIVETDGRVCSCGARGCLESEISGNSIAIATGRPSAESDAITIQRSGRLLGRAIASTANLLDLDFAVVGGSVALGFGPPFFDAARTEVQRASRLEFSRATTIVPAALGVECGVVGAAAVAWEYWRPEHSGARPRARLCRTSG